MDRIYLITIFLLLCFASKMNAQPLIVDSLRDIFNSKAPDTNRLESAKELTLSYAYIDTVQAKIYIQKGKALAVKMGDEESIMFFDLQKAKVLQAGKNYEKAHQLCSKVYNQNNKRNYPIINAIYNLTMGEGYSLQSNHLKAIHFKKEAIAIFETLDDRQTLADVYLSLANNYFRYGNYDLSLKYFNKNLAYYKKTEKKTAYALTLNDIGAVYYSQGKYNKAIDYYIESLATYQEIDDKKAIARSLNNIGAVHVNQGNYAEALNYYEKSLKIREKIGDKSEIGSSLIHMGGIYERQGNYSKALANFEKGLKMSKETDDKFQSAVALKDIARVYEQQGHYEKAIAYHFKSLKISEETGDTKGIASSFADIGFCHLKYLGSEDSAFVYFKKSINICEEMKFSNLLRDILNEIGDIYTHKGLLSKALNFYYNALNIVEETQDTLGIASINNSLASVYKTQNNYDKAMSYLQIALQHYQSIAHESGIAGTKNKIANLLLKKNHYDSSLSYALQALLSYQLLQDSCQLSHSFLNLGKAYLSLQKADSAIYYLEKGSEQAIKCNSNEVLAQTHLALGKIYATQKLNNKAFIPFQQAMKYAQLSGNRKSIKEAAAHLHPIYKKRGQLGKAYETLNLYQANKDSLFNEENTRNIIQKEMEYTYAKAEQEKALVKQQAGVQKEPRLLRQTIFAYMFFGAFVGMILMALAFRRNFRNKQKANALLQKQKEELEELDHFKSRLFANISHELRTPLTLISSPVNTLISKDNVHDEDIKHQLQLVHRNSQQLRELVDDILDLSTLDSTMVELNVEPAELQPFLNWVFSNFESLAKQLGINYSIQLDEFKDIWVDIDTSNVEKILNNLLSNAIKHTSSGGKVQLKAWIADQKIKLTVSDTGNGIAAADLPYIFDRYFQSNQPDTPIQKGMGIGLALTKELVQMMNGNISVTSEEGKGSQFFVEIPYHETNGPQEIVLPAEETTEEVKMQHLELTEIPVSEKRFHVLITEDHFDMRQFLHELLVMKYHVHLASNGKEALKVLSKTKIDLIVSDVIMPEMDGFALLQHIKNSEKYRHIPFITLTAMDAKDIKLNAVSLGVDDYLTKPFSPKELLARAHNLLLRYEVRLEANLGTRFENQLVLEESPSGELEGVALYPENPKEEPVPEDETDIQWLEQVAEAMRKQLENPEFQMADLASEFNLSERHFHRKVKQITGMPPKKYQLEVALQKGRYLLERKQYGNVTAICYSVGMSNVSRFSQLYEARFGKKPKEYFGATVS